MWYPGRSRGPRHPQTLDPETWKSYSRSRQLRKESSIGKRFEGPWAAVGGEGGIRDSGGKGVALGLTSLTGCIGRPSQTLNGFYSTNYHVANYPSKEVMAQKTG